jgi:anthranilate synthase component 1
MIEKVRVNTTYKKVLADLTTPVALYYQLRDQYAETLLLESSDYSSKENSMSFLCYDPLLQIEVSDDQFVTSNLVTRESSHHPITDLVADVQGALTMISQRSPSDVDRFLGFFGFTSFDAVQYFDTIQTSTADHLDLPILRYAFYRHIIVFDHFTEDLYLIDNTPDGEKSKLPAMHRLIKQSQVQPFDFKTAGTEQENMTDQAFLDIVDQCKAHCQRGDVFQIVPSRRFSQAYKGDDFNVYRALRSINPSPYLFYYDYTDYRIFGSSPEAQIVVDNGTAEIHPIAGTFKRTGNDLEDQASAEALREDPKESAEHIMLVDLARNDLSKHCDDVEVETFKEVQFFSHVIHLTSVVKGNLKPGATGYQVFADTFPAGTLSGAPKHKALELIYGMEATQRRAYGGGIGMIHLNGDINHAIIIRSFVSTEGSLYYQAGAGIVIGSDSHSELQEVNNKLAALKRAIAKAESI